MKGLEVFHLTRRIMNVYEERCSSICKANNINQNCLDVLLFLANNPEYNTAKDICEVRGIKSGIASVVVEKLIKKGYLERKVDEHDRRINRIFITEAASETVEQAQKIQKEFFIELLEDVTAEEIEVFKQMLGKLDDKIERMNN